MDSIKEPEADAQRDNTFLYNESFDVKRDACAEPFDLRPSVELDDDINTRISDIKKKLELSKRSRENSL